MPSVKGADPDDKSGGKLREQQFQTLAEAIAHAEGELETERKVPVAVLVYSVRTPEGLTEFAQTELHFVGGGRGGYIPGRTTTGAFVVRPVSIHGPGHAVELHVVVDGYERYIKRDILRAGELVVWDEIVPELITERSAASIVGRVRVEDENEDLEGLVINVDGSPVAFTDALGYFVVDNVRSGKLRLTTHKDGYVGMYANVTVERGHEGACELVGYRKRTARVRWAYQPDGTRRFDGSAETGTAVLEPQTLSRVSFGKGFAQVDGRSDFAVRQVRDELVLRHADGFGPKYPGSTLVKDKTFDEIHEAPELGYTNRTERELRPGDVFVFRCYDGKHYGKLEVLEVLKDDPSRESR